MQKKPPHSRKQTSGAISRKFFLLAGIAMLVFIADQVTKYIIRAKMPLGSVIEVLPFFQLSHVSNTGAGFSLFTGYNHLLLWVYVIAVGAIIFFYSDINEKQAPWIGLALGGILGNFYDRVFFGAVTDFLDFIVWPVFNIADSSLVIGVCGLIIADILQERNSKDQAKHKAKKQ